MTDHLASAIIGSPTGRPRTATIAATGAGDIATAITSAGQVIACVDDVRGWRHIVFDPVSVEWDQAGVPHVVRSLARRPTQGTVTAYAADSSGPAGTVDAGGLSWSARFLSTVAVGDTVQLEWTPAGPLGWRGAAVAAMLPDGVTQYAAPDRAAALPGSPAAAPDPRIDQTVRAVQSGSHDGGHWLTGDTLAQGTPAGGSATAGLWCYGGGLSWLTGRTIVSATIDLRRTASGGRAAQVILMAHTAQTMADDPAWVGSAFGGPTLLPGESATFAIPPSALAALTTGAASGIGIVGSDWCDIAGIGATITSGRLHIVSRTD